MKKISIALLTLLTMILVSCSTQSISNSNAINMMASYKHANNTKDFASSEEFEQIKFLIQLLDYAQEGNVSNRIGEGKLLSTKKEQFQFIIALNEREQSDLMKKMLQNHINFKEDSMEIRKENILSLIQMAAAKKDEGVWEYIVENRYPYEVEGDVFRLSEQNKMGSELCREYKDWKYEFQDDGSLKVSCKINIETDYGYVYNLEVILHKNDKSVFGGYTADYMILRLATSTEINNDISVHNTWDKYIPPTSFGNSFEDYIFRLDGDMYQMPVLLDEMLNKGWTVNISDKEDIQECILRKNGKEVSCVLWKHASGENTDKKWYVVQLKTQVGEKWTDIDFELFGDIRKGEKMLENKEYYFKDYLYFGYFFIETHTDKDNNIIGFEMRYAPSHTDRAKRAELLCEDITGECLHVKEQGEIELKHGVKYVLPLNNKEKTLQLRRLNKVEWGKYVYVIFLIEGERREIVATIPYQAKFILCRDENGSSHIKVEGYDTAVHSEAKIVSLGAY